MGDGRFGGGAHVTRHMIHRRAASCRVSKGRSDVARGGDGVSERAHERASGPKTRRTGAWPLACGPRHAEKHGAGGCGRSARTTRRTGISSQRDLSSQRALNPPTSSSTPPPRSYSLWFVHGTSPGEGRGGFLWSSLEPRAPFARTGASWFLVWKCSANRANLIYGRVFARSLTPKRAAKLGLWASAVHVRSRLCSRFFGGPAKK